MLFLTKFENEYIIRKREKMKAINLIVQCYKRRFEMIKSESELINQKRYMQDFSMYDT
jgi:hypothetical protein